MREADTWSQMILDELDHMIYLTDMGSYQLLYINQFGKQLLGIGDETEYLGKMCYQVLQGYSSPCSFCTNHKLKEQRVYTWLNHNQMLDEYFVIKDKIVHKNGRALRLETAYNVTSTEQEKEELKFKLTNEETLVHCIQTLGEYEDMDTAIHELLKIIADFYHGDCAYIFEVDDNRQNIKKTYEWCTGQDQCRDRQIISRKKAEKWLNQLQEKGEFYIPNQNGESAGSEILKLRGADSLVAAPLAEKGRDHWINRCG